MVRFVRFRLFVCAALIAASAATACAQNNVKLSLNLLYDGPNPGTSGGHFQLVAQTTSTFGLASVNSFISNINTTGILYGPGINADTIAGSPLVVEGNPVNLLYAQATTQPGVVINVGKGPGTGGNLLFDVLGDSTWNNSAFIASGSFGTAKPAFIPDVHGNVTDSNVLSRATAPFGASINANTTFVVREGLRGDYNHDQVVDSRDYTIWRDNFGSTTNLLADGSLNGVIDLDDFNAWKVNFGIHFPIAGGGGLGSPAGVPEPSTLALLTAACVPFWMRRRSSMRPL